MNKSARYCAKLMLYIACVFLVLWYITPNPSMKFYKPKLDDISKYTYIDENNVCYKYKINEIHS